MSEWRMRNLTPNHYKMAVEPIEYIMRNNLNFCAGNIIKYASRYDKKGTPIEDLTKIVHYANILINEYVKTDTE